MALASARGTSGSVASDCVLVGIDAGTTKVRALAFSPDGRLLAEASRPNAYQRPQTGWVQYDADELWRATAAALAELTGKLDTPQRIAGLAVASVGEAAVPLDAKGEPTHAAMAWFDERTKAQAQWLGEHIGAERLFHSSGLRLDPMFGLCKMLWLRQHAAESWGRTERWLNIADYLAWRLSGTMATDFSLASRTLLLDLRRLCWAETVLQDLGLSTQLTAPLAASGTPLGTVTAESAAVTGLPRHCVIGVGGHDHIMGALAVGAWRPGTLLNSLGTAEVLLMAREKPVFSSGFAARGYSQGAVVLEQPHYYVVGAMTTSGACVEWFRHTLADGASHDSLISEARSVSAGSDGLWFMPQMRVATPPRQDPNMRGAFLGLSPDHGISQLYRALLEGLAYDSRNAVDGLTELDDGPPLSRILAIGGDSRNDLLMRIKSAVFQRPITIIEQSEAVSMGAALLGGLAAGVFANIETALDSIALATRTVTPDDTMREVYAGLYPRYRGLPDALGALQNKLRVG